MIVLRKCLFELVPGKIVTKVPLKRARNFNNLAELFTNSGDTRFTLGESSFLKNAPRAAMKHFQC